VTHSLAFFVNLVKKAVLACEKVTAFLKYIKSCTDDEKINDMKTFYLPSILRIFVLLFIIFHSSLGFLSPTLVLSSSELKVAQDINIRFVMEWAVAADEIITIKLPRFTRSTGTKETVAGSSLPFGTVTLSPSMTFLAAWNEGTILDIGGPFATSSLQIKLISGIIIENPLLFVNLTVYAVNGISVYCGFPDSVAVGQGMFSF